MRAWENRPDTIVSDEPFYASYLARTGREHPGREQVLAAQPQDWRDVVANLQRPLPAGCEIHYQKHMTHHINDTIDLGWLAGVRSCFLVRQPRNMLASLLKVLPDADVDDTGLPQQRRLFDYVRQALDPAPPVIHSADVLRDPAGLMLALCRKLGVPFSDRMLSWPAGPRDSDGIWAPYWYDAVERSTGFAPYRPAEPEIPRDKWPVLEQCEELYAGMAASRLQE